MDKSNSNSFLGCGLLVPAEDRKVRSLPAILQWAIPGLECGWQCH